jgi:hypothetical protein
MPFIYFFLFFVLVLLPETFFHFVFNYISMYSEVYQDYLYINKIPTSMYSEVYQDYLYINKIPMRMVEELMPYLNPCTIIWREQLEWIPFFYSYYEIFYMLVEIFLIYLFFGC